MRGRRDEEQASHRAFRIEGVERDLDEELAFHFAETVDELVAGGMSREEAEAEARRRFGDESRYRAELETTDRHMEVRRRRRDLLGAAAQTLRIALRSVRRSPGLSAGIVLTLALGIGANATMFSTIDRLLLRAPDQVREPETLRRLIVERYDASVGAWTPGRFSYEEYTRLADAPFAERFAAYFGDGGVMGEGSATRQVRGWAVTGNYWDVLGVRPHLGRLFTEEDDRPGADHVIVLGYDLWVRDYAGDASVIGRTVRLGSTPHTVLGVAPKGFTGAELLNTNIDY